MCILFFSVFMSQCKMSDEEYHEYDDKCIVYGVTDTDNYNNVDDTYKEDIINALFDKMVTINSSGEVLPQLLETYKISSDELEYVLTVRSNAMWSDGSTITADDLINTFRRVLSPVNKNNYAKELYSIYGAKDYHEGRVDFNGVAISKVDKRNIKIRMNKKDDDLLKKLSESNFRIIDNSFSEEKLMSNYKDIKYSGPFVIDSIDKDSMILSKNKYYFENIENNFKVKIVKYDGVEQALVDMQLGKVDIFKGVPYSEAINLYENNNLECIPTTKTLVLGFDLRDGKITSDINFRRVIERTLSYSLYRYNGVLCGEYQCTLGNIRRDKSVSTGEIFTQGKDVENNIDESKKENILIAKNLYNDMNINGTTTITLGVDEKYYDIAKFIKKIIEDNFDMSIDICTDKISIENCDMYIKEYDFSEENLKSSYLDMFKNCKWSDSEFKSVFNKINGELTDDQLFKLSTIVKNKIPYIPVFFINNVACKSNRIDFASLDNMGNIDLKNIELKN